MFFIEHVEDLFDLEDVGLVEAWSLVRSSVEFGLDWLLLRLLIGSAHVCLVNYYIHQ